MPQSRTDLDQEPVSATVVEGVARNVHGESLDDARETFRARWQAKINRRREQAAQASDTVKACGQVIATIFYGGTAVGGLLGFGVGCTTGDLGALVFTVITLAVVGFLLAIVPALLVRMYSSVTRQRAERLEWEADELECM